MASLDLAEIAAALMRRWWLVLLVPVVALAGLVYRDRSLPYHRRSVQPSSSRATPKSRAVPKSLN
jgi:hypothetical protein